ncbi:hypothetical protein QFC20_001903 [Naganishia adeliensis]|uniref:Uncharacterized protein n=1 Tax=Naganishia adeliensis TaxID=92952 RepID=A0ACC2WSP3_9TREE|nr:hypothetical protein QFC20_001903 [Naganishia adeliensis]
MGEPDEVPEAIPGMGLQLRLQSTAIRHPHDALGRDGLPRSRRCRDASSGKYRHQQDRTRPHLRQSQLRKSAHGPPTRRTTSYECVPSRPDRSSLGRQVPGNQRTKRGTHRAGLTVIHWHQRAEPEQSSLRNQGLRLSHAIPQVHYLSLGVGLDPRQQAHVVMHRWMTPGNPGYNEQIALNVPHFESLAVGQERFEAVIITEQMREAAWRFGHRQQMILDGTFGVSQERLLCFILMVVDQNYRRVPVGFILFTPLAEHLATHGSYDADVLVRLLQAWKVGIEQGRNDEFEPYSFLTDNDTKERNALIETWNNIVLLLCRYHLRQSWGNGKRSRYPRILRGERANDRIIAQAIEDIKTRVKSLEDRLLNALTFEAALNALQEETALFLRMKEDERLPGEVRATAAGAWDYLGYLRKTWVKENLWMAWAEIGRTRLAQALDIPLGSVINTSNHLESFNNVLKNGWLRRCSTGRGRRLRTDVLVALLITRVIPGIFRTRAIAERERNWMANLLEGLLAPQLIDAANLNRRAAREQRALEGVGIAQVQAWIDPAEDPNNPRQVAAQEIFARGRVQQLWLAFDFSRLNAVCVPEFNPNRLRIFDEMNYELCLRYTVMMGCWTGRCSCPDFSQRGGACKHLRALQLSINTADNRPSGLPLIHFPSSLEEAKEAEQQLLPQPSTSTLQPFQPHPTSTKEYEKQVLESVTELGEQLMESGEEFAVPEDAEVVVEETVDGEEYLDEDDVGGGIDLRGCLKSILSVAQRGVAEQMVVHAMHELGNAVKAVEAVDRLMRESKVPFVDDTMVDCLQALVSKTLSLVSRGTGDGFSQSSQKVTVGGEGEVNVAVGDGGKLVDQMVDQPMNQMTKLTQSSSGRIPSSATQPPTDSQGRILLPLPKQVKQPRKQSWCDR